MIPMFKEIVAAEGCVPVPLFSFALCLCVAVVIS